MKKLVLALAAVAMIATPALADFSFYGSMRAMTFYTSFDDGNAATSDVKNFDVLLQNNSRFGFKATTGDVAGRVEVGVGGAAASGLSSYLRLIYGEVKLGDGTLLVGQTYTPYTKFSSMVSSVDQGMEGFGALYDGRNPMIKYTMNNGLYLAAIQNKQEGAANEVMIPKLVVGYAGKAGDISYNAGFAYQTYESAIATNPNIVSYLAYVNGNAKFGEIGLLYGLHYAQNPVEFGLGTRPGVTATANDDVKGFGGMLELQMSGANIGVGYVVDESDAAAAVADNQMVVYANYAVQVAKGFTIIPEVSYWDYMDDQGLLGKVDGGNDLYVGAKWQMDF